MIKEKLKKAGQFAMGALACGGIGAVTVAPAVASVPATDVSQVATISAAVPAINIVADMGSFFAAITWNFSSATGELEGLGTAIATAGGLAIAAGLVVYGLWKGVGFVLKIFSRVSSK